MQACSKAEIIMTDMAPSENVIAPPSTGKKKKARKVFGNILAERDLNHSLSYTPSPFKSTDDSDDLLPSSVGAQRVAATLFSIKESTGGATRLCSDGRRKSDNSSSQKSTSRSETSTVVVKPFSNIFGDGVGDSKNDDNKENPLDVQVPKSIRVPADKNSVDSKLSVETIADNNNHSGSSSSNRRALLIPRPGKTNRKINSHSVNQALNGAKRAKERLMHEKSKAAAMTRNQWKEEKEEALDFQEEFEKMRREQLNLQHQLSSQFSKAKAKRNQELRQVQLEQTEKEFIFKSTVAREQQQKLKEMEETRRRHSIDARAKIRANNRHAEEKLRLMKIEEERAIFEEQQKFSQAHQQYKKDRLESAKKNFRFRGGDALRIRDLFRDMEEKRKQENHESFKLMLEAARDAKEYENELAKQRRESLALRNALAKEQRQRAEKERSRMQQAEHESFELKRAGDMDADQYKTQLEIDRRKSLESRNEESRKQRELMAKKKSDQLVAEQQSYRLKFEADKDAEAYAKELARLRRESLEQRGVAAREIRNKQSEEEAERLEKDHASWELENAGKKDVEKYLEEEEKIRRKSLARRNALAKQQREDDEKRRANDLQAEHEFYETKWDGERDAQKYLRDLEEKRRNSIISRNIEARKHRNLAADQRAADLKAEHENYELTRAAAKDVEACEKKQRQERQDSLVFRNKERARHAMVIEELNSLAREEETEYFMLKWAGENDAKEYLAQIEEERRKSTHRRNEEAKRHREMDEEMRRQELLQAHQDEELRAAGQKDVESYKRECAERDRTSLQFRGKEAMIRRLEDQNRLDVDRERQSKNAELETLARQDVEEYLKKCKNQRRKSLALRAKERRRHAEWVRSEEHKQLQEQSNGARLRARDSRSMQLARRHERMEQALEALRHANCTFSSFPAP